MKRYTSRAVAVSALLLLASTMAALGQTIVSDTLVVGSSGSDQNTIEPYNYNAVIGASNTVGAFAHRSLSIGLSNVIGDVYDALVLGQGNQINGQSGSALVLGTSNSSGSLASSLVVGEFNTNEYDGSNLTQSSLIAGSYNFAKELQSVLLSGSNNSVSGTSYGAVIGRGLVAAGESDHILIGSYNALSDPVKPAVFTVANGTGAELSQRSNAFVIYANGDVIIKKRQGDILMGEFGN